MLERTRMFLLDTIMQLCDCIYDWAWSKTLDIEFSDDLSPGGTDDE